MQSGFSCIHYSTLGSMERGGLFASIAGWWLRPPLLLMILMKMNFIGCASHARPARRRRRREVHNSPHYGLRGAGGWWGMHSIGIIAPDGHEWQRQQQQDEDRWRWFLLMNQRCEAKTVPTCNYSPSEGKRWDGRQPQRRWEAAVTSWTFRLLWTQGNGWRKGIEDLQIDRTFELEEIGSVRSFY